MAKGGLQQEPLRPGLALAGQLGEGCHDVLAALPRPHAQLAPSLQLCLDQWKPAVVLYGQLQHLHQHRRFRNARAAAQRRHRRQGPHGHSRKAAHDGVAEGLDQDVRLGILLPCRRRDPLRSEQRHAKKAILTQSVPVHGSLQVGRRWHQAHQSGESGGDARQQQRRVRLADAQRGRQRRVAVGAHRVHIGTHLQQGRGRLGRSFPVHVRPIGDAEAEHGVGIFVDPTHGERAALLRHGLAQPTAVGRERGKTTHLLPVPHGRGA
mmetsp:Transcript_79647/g.204899  ORF Transcript_79647/g.204899 Transcript_79647/m.204899 type:complete len:265 (-) Transcript_79647:658-1452(-)